MADKNGKKIETDVSGDKEQKVSILEGITTLLQRGYKFFKLDGKGNYVAKGERIKLNGRGWPRREEADESPLEPAEIITKDYFFEELKEQYAKIISDIKIISGLQHARNQVFMGIFNDITTFKNMVNENAEQLKNEEKLTEANSLLKSIETAEEILQRYYLSGLGDYGYEREKRAIAFEENRRAVELYRKVRHKSLSNDAGFGPHITITNNQNLDLTDNNENR
ncbi:MAG: hypothetical protein J6J36_01395 [Clostridia bacterium]|nr:hypothetical protein [Clostridia bacterium]